MINPIIKKLNSNDIQSATWMKIKEIYERRLEKIRIRNDSTLDPEKTARTRGQIEEIKRLLALGESPAPLEADDN